MATLRALNKSASKVFNILIDGLEPQTSRKIETSGGVFMAVHVELLEVWGDTKFYSVAHYYESNGDLVADPDVQFAVIGEQIIPHAITQGGLGRFQSSVTFEAGKPVGFKPHAQADLASFCHMWMRNINQQQDLKTWQKSRAKKS